jgi:hypothetical protein
LVASGVIGSITTFVARVGVNKKKTSGRSSGIIFAKVITNAPKTTMDVASTNVSILDNKIGGSTTFAKIIPYIMYVDSRQF